MSQYAEEASLADEKRDLARARIVRATRRALAARGLATTVDDVAETAGVSRRTVFRHFPSRENLFAVAIGEGIRSYAEHIPPPPSDRDDDLSGWLVDLMLATHNINARNGRIYWELSALEPDLEGELAAVAAERRDARRRFASNVTTKLWRARDGRGKPPPWLTDAVAVHLSGFTTQSLAGDFDRSPDDVARVSARIIEASLIAALADRP
jgi:AcrR family transcriptional regulator